MTKTIDAKCEYKVGNKCRLVGYNLLATQPENYAKCTCSQGSASCSRYRIHSGVNVLRGATVTIRFNDLHI